MPSDWLRQLPFNGGMEAVAGIGGLWLAVDEELRTPSGAARALVSRAGPRHRGGDWRQAELALTEDFSPTDADHVKGRDFLMLFRRYSLLRGVGARIEQVSIAGTAEDPRIVTRPVAELAPPLNVDNMEGLAVRREGARVFFYLVSDDNFSGAQRTLLMKFELLQK